MKRQCDSFQRRERNNCKVGTVGWGVKGHKYLTATEENSVSKHALLCSAARGVKTPYVDPLMVGKCMIIAFFLLHCSD